MVRKLIFFGLLAFVPVSLLADVLGWGEVVVFVTAALAIIPLAGWMGHATEEIAVVLGPSWGGLLNATFGNATELIIALIALNEGLVGVVKASLTGSIIGNLLLVLGLSMLLGGLKFKEQTFQSVVARVNASSMNLAVIAMLLPTAMVATSDGITSETLLTLSKAVAFVLIGVYILTLLFSMKTHSYLYEVGTVEDIDAAASMEPDPGHSEAEEHKPNLVLWVAVLLGATLVVALESELSILLKLETTWIRINNKLLKKP